jgi:hypothetical protein
MARSGKPERAFFVVPQTIHSNRIFRPPNVIDKMIDILYSMISGGGKGVNTHAVPLPQSHLQVLL